ncbi:MULTISPECIES: hypothetical protein [Amycolatopsis]|uniref:hypothetical protein n=1 Tax=Amycolatopsis TaxID=1813 RepID=UPI00174B076A|nr:hypothetical protein [Amycolatopsis bullii]
MRSGKRRPNRRRRRGSAWSGAAPERLQYPLFAAGLGGPLGTGRQWMPWIGIDDLADAHLHALTRSVLNGPVNAVSPEPVRNAEYTRTPGGVLDRRTLPPGHRRAVPGGPRWFRPP